MRGLGSIYYYWGSVVWHPKKRLRRRLWWMPPAMNNSESVITQLHKARLPCLLNLTLYNSSTIESDIVLLMYAKRFLLWWILQSIIMYCSHLSIFRALSEDPLRPCPEHPPRHPARSTAWCVNSRFFLPHSAQGTRHVATVLSWFKIVLLLALRLCRIN